MNKKTIWAVTALVGGYIFCQMLADVAATKIIQLGAVTIPAGTFVFTITFTLRDMLHKRLGKEWTRAAIFMAGALNVVMALYMRWMASFAAPEYFALAAEWGEIFAIVPSIVIASIVAEVVSELIDTEVYHAIQHRFTGKMQFARVLISNAVSLPIDSVIFAFGAFALLPLIFGGNTMPSSVIWSMVWGQIIWKGAVTLVSLPGIYLVQDRMIIGSAKAG